VLFRDDRNRFGPRAPTVGPIDIDDFVARVSCLCGKHGLCPPFEHRTLAAEWFADDILPAHCLVTIERGLREYAGSVRSGSAERLFLYFGRLIRYEWDRPAS
jgi:hypothetical protein